MSISPDHLLAHVIKPTLTYLADETGLNLDSENAAMLLLGTQAHESLGGYWLSQAPTGPARGIYQMEVKTHDWLWSDYLDRRHDLANAAMKMVPRGQNVAERMVTDLSYATAMCRIYYWAVPEPIPGDLKGWASYWKRHWNTAAGAGTEAKFIEDWNRWAKSAIS